jgi:UPF0755 protein
MDMQQDSFYITEKKRSPIRIISLLLALIIVILLTVGAYFLTKVNEAASTVSVPADFVVNKGASTKAIARELSDQNVIGSYWSFILYSKLTGASSKIQAGNYVLNRNMSIAEIVDVLTAGKVVFSDRKVTIVEGMTNKQIATSLDSRTIFSATQFNQALSTGNYNFKYKDVAAKLNYEGFLFPDTYVISKEASAEQLVQKMLTNFESKITSQMQTDMDAKKLSLMDVVTMASIIEKEVGRNKETITDADIQAMQQERKIVSSVFYNRLEIGMALESDATVNYVTGKSDRSATIADTKLKSAYNTYQVRGLPPGPISNPGIDSIMAAIYPADTDYLFFLNSPDGVAYFAKTLSEHNLNRQKYLN